jgi:8-amino-7-oxononanoate synthase
MQRPSVDKKVNFEQKIPKSIVDRLETRALDGNLRSLNPEKKLVDFFSNDYLGFSTTGLLRKKLQLDPLYLELTQFGSTGSRLLSGDSILHHKLEEKIAKYHFAESAILFNNGFSANFGLLASLPTRHDTIIVDSLSHASIIDGQNASIAKNKWKFEHNDLEDLEDKIKNSVGDIYLVTESVFSMDGDFAPLEEIAKLSQKYGAYLIVDEAHAIGIFGPNGSGRICELGLEDQIFARVITFGKALGASGAAVLTNIETKNFLINFSRPLIYSTAIEQETVLGISNAYDILKETFTSSVPLYFLIHEFQAALKKETSSDRYLKSISPIQGILFKDNDSVKKAAKVLANENIDCRAILSPTVQKGQERLRIILHSFNSNSEVQLLMHTLKINGFLFE